MDYVIKDRIKKIEEPLQVISRYEPSRFPLPLIIREKIYTDGSVEVLKVIPIR